MNTARIAIITYLISGAFFIAGIANPIMGSKLFLSINRDDVYLWSSITDFFRDGEWFLASLLLIFTFLLPILKYVFLGSRLFLNKGSDQLNKLLEIVNKWAMLDVFVLAVLIVNLKFDSLILVTEVRIGTTFFILSILLLMATSALLRKASSIT
ncbi:MAG: paraquat-inducible protein A [Saprospiraceae bacterium]|nr:paraquat-inducible protein A [Saprospiraceae bacterium]